MKRLDALIATQKTRTNFNGLFLKKLDLTVKKVQIFLNPNCSFFQIFFKNVHVHKVFEGLYEKSWYTECIDEETGFVLSTILKKICKKL